MQFVRCIKPNTISQNKFDSRHVLQQLKYSGIGELLEFRKQGYPYRYSYSDFVSKYSYLLRRNKGPLTNSTAVITNNMTDKMKCQEILKLIKSTKEYRMECGNTRIFLGNAIHLELKKLHSCIRIEMAVLIQRLARGWLTKKKLKSRIKVMNELPIILKNKNREKLTHFVKEYNHYLLDEFEEVEDKDHTGITTKNSFIARILQAKMLNEQISIVEDGANEVRRVLQRMQDPSLRIRPGVLENALQQIQSKSSENVDEWLSEDVKETVKIGMNYILRVQTLSSLRAGITSALLDGDTMEAEMSLSILENMTDQKSFWKEVIEARTTIEKIEREQSIAIPLLIDAMNNGIFNGVSSDVYTTESEEMSQMIGSSSGSGSHSRTNSLGSPGRLSTVTFAVSDGSDGAHALDVAIIQATRVGIVTTRGRNCVEAAKILKDLIRETLLNEEQTDWLKVTNLLSKANAINASSFASEIFLRFVTMLDHSSTMDELILSLSNGGAAKIDNGKVAATSTIRKNQSAKFDFGCVRIEPLKTLLRQSETMGVGMTNEMLMSSANIVLRIREAQLRSEWQDINQALKDADSLEQVHPSIVSELKIAKEALSSWKRFESEASANVDQSFYVTVSTPNGSTHQATLRVNGASHQVSMKEGDDISSKKIKTMMTDGNNNEEKINNNVKRNIVNGISLSTKDIHTIIVGASNVRKLTMMTERDMTKGLQNMKSYQTVVSKKITKNFKKKYKTETYTFVFDSSIDRTMFCQSIVAMQNTNHVCFQYDGEVWSTPTLLEYGVMTVGGVASRAKYRTLVLDLEHGTIERRSKKAKKSKNSSKDSTSKNNKKMIIIDKDTRIDIDTRDPSANHVHIWSAASYHKKGALTKMDIVFSSSILAQRFSGRVRALAMMAYHEAAGLGRYKMNEAKFIPSIRDKMNSELHLNSTENRLRLEEYRAADPLGIYITTWNAGGTKRPSKNAFKRWLERSKYDVYVIGLQECGSPDKWWKGILDHLNENVPIARVGKMESTSIATAKEEKGGDSKIHESKLSSISIETVNEVMDSILLKCSMCDVPIQNGRERKCCCCQQFLCLLCCPDNVYQEHTVGDISSVSLTWLCSTCMPVDPGDDYDDDDEMNVKKGKKIKSVIVHDMRNETPASSTHIVTTNVNKKVSKRRLTVDEMVVYAENNGYDSSSLLNTLNAKKCVVCLDVFKKKKSRRMCQECGLAMCKNCTKKEIVSSSTIKLTETCTTCTKKIVIEHQSNEKNLKKKLLRADSDGKVTFVTQGEIDAWVTKTNLNITTGNIDDSKGDSGRSIHKENSDKHRRQSSAVHNVSKDGNQMSLIPLATKGGTVDTSSRVRSNTAMNDGRLRSKGPPGHHTLSANHRHHHHLPNQDKYMQISLVTLQHIQMGVFIRERYSSRLTKVETCTVACGLGGVWGNKGGVGVSFKIDGVNTFSFVAAHLAARASRKRDLARNRDFHKIMKNINIASNNKNGNDLYSSTDHLFFLGDLNYRVTYGSPGSEDEFIKVKQKVKERKFEELISKDQLRGHIENKRAFVNFQEGDIQVSVF